MTMPELLPIQEDATDRDERLDRWLTNFYKIFDPNLSELRFALRASWMRYVDDHAFSLAHNLAFDPKTRSMTREEDTVNDVHIATTSDTKWKLIAPLVRQRKFTPIRDKPAEAELAIHEWLRKQPEFPDNYPIRVAGMKQPFDLGGTPVITLDTVTFIDGIPLEKPKDLTEARRLIAQISGNRVATYTGWVLGMQVKSGAYVRLANNTSVTYTVKPLTGEMIATYVETAGTVLDVPAGIDLTTPQARSQFIDFTEPVILYGQNNLKHKGSLNLRGDDLLSVVFDPIFAGVPVHAIRAILPLINEIYLHGDPLYTEEQPRIEV